VLININISLYCTLVLGFHWHHGCLDIPLLFPLRLIPLSAHQEPCRHGVENARFFQTESYLKYVLKLDSSQYIYINILEKNVSIFLDKYCIDTWISDIYMYIDQPTIVGRHTLSNVCCLLCYIDNIPRYAK